MEGTRNQKAGILKQGCRACIGIQPDEAREAIAAVAEKTGADLRFANQDFQCFEQYGRMVFEDGHGLLDLDLPALAGRFQIDNAGLAIAAIRMLDDERITPDHIQDGLARVTWPARMERLEPGYLHTLVPAGTELWLETAPQGDFFFRLWISRITESFSNWLG